MTFPEPNPDFVDLECPRGLKMIAGNTQNPQKNTPLGTQRPNKIQHIFDFRATCTLFFSSFAFLIILLPSGRLREAKSSEKHCRVVRNRRIHFFKTKHIFCKKMYPRASQNDPRHTPGHTQGPGRPHFGRLFGSRFRSPEHVLRIGSKKASAAGKSLSLFPIYTYRYMCTHVCMDSAI